MKKYNQKPYWFIIKGEKHLNFCGYTPRFWTLNNECSHYFLLNRCPDSPECIGCNAIKCLTEQEAKDKCKEALTLKQYGNFYWYINEQKHTFGFAVHFPRFESEGIGFVNFHCVLSEIISTDEITIK